MKAKFNSPRALMVHVSCNFPTITIANIHSPIIVQNTVGSNTLCMASFEEQYSLSLAEYPIKTNMSAFTDEHEFR